MTKTETSSSEPNLTDNKTVQESEAESIDSEKGTDLPEGAKNFQHALQQAREREKQIQQELEEARRTLGSYKEEEKQKKLAAMSEVERYKTLAEEESARRGKLELQLIVKEQLTGKQLPKGIVDLLVKNPWAIPAVSEELGDEFTWDDAVESVKRHLPAYLESLVVANETAPAGEESLPRMVDSERSVDSGVIKEHFYTKEEVELLSKDPNEWEKHRAKILKQLAKSGGTLPQQ